MKLGINFAQIKLQAAVEDEDYQPESPPASSTALNYADKLRTCFKSKGAYDDVLCPMRLIK